MDEANQFYFPGGAWMVVPIVPGQPLEEFSGWATAKSPASGIEGVLIFSDEAQADQFVEDRRRVGKWRTFHLPEVSNVVIGLMNIASTGERFVVLDGGTKAYARAIEIAEFVKRLRPEAEGPENGNPGFSFHGD